MYIDPDFNVYGCLMHQDPGLRIDTVTIKGEFNFYKNDPMNGFHRRDCFIMEYGRGKQNEKIQ